MSGEPDNAATRREGFCSIDRSAEFAFRIPATDGGRPFDFVDRKNDDYDCACVYRGGENLGTGSRLTEAWEDYLYTVPDGAPVSEGDLERMWAAYGEWIDSPNNKTLPTEGAAQEQ